MRGISSALLASFLGLGIIALAAPLRDTRAEVQPNDTAVPYIVNGVLTSDFPSTGALLLGNDPDSARVGCSGIMIGCETFLTAAHCVCDLNGVDCQGASAPDPWDYLVFLQHGGFFSISSIAVHPDFVYPVADLAVVKLATPVDGIRPTPINTTVTPSFGTSATITGFGRSEGLTGDSGLKRTGAVMTESCLGGISNTTSVCWFFTDPVGPPGDDSSTCHGDSGGPLFVDFGVGDTVAGTTSGGPAADCLPPNFPYDANVYHYRTWIETQGGADLTNATCGSLPQVGDPGVEVHGFSGSVSSGKPEGRHSFQVLAGVDLLRVTMNASQEDPNDFDLYVKAGSPPATSNYDCRAYGGNQWGSCEFASPAEGAWHVMVHQYEGDGVYQTTATTFGILGCSDGVDNDGDGLTDFVGGDPGCADDLDPSERDPTLLCDDGADNDGDGRIDFDPVTFANPGNQTTFPSGSGDPGCKEPSWFSENPKCQDGLDNDDDGKTDYDAGLSRNGFADPDGLDPQCEGRPYRNREPPCGLGVELALLLPPLMWLWRRRTYKR